jgi:hypothetical protein
MIRLMSSSMGCSAPPFGAFRMTPQNLPGLENAASRGADITLVGPDRCLRAVQEFVPDLAVMHLGRRGLQAVHDAAVGIHADMRLHAEIPVVALLRRRHLGIAGLGFVLGRRRRIDDRRVDQRARAQGDALVGKVTVHLGEQLLRQLMLLQQVAEVEDRGLVRDPVVAKLDAREPAHRVAVVEHLLGHRVAQAHTSCCRKYTRSIVSSGIGGRPPFGPAFG